MTTATRLSRSILLGMLCSISYVQASTPICEAPPEEDPFRCLESPNDENARRWAIQQTTLTKTFFEGRENFTTLKDDLAKVMKSDLTIAREHGGYIYNLWTDSSEHIQGLLRKTTIASYRTTTPQWETVLDMDALSRKEGKKQKLIRMECLEGTSKCLFSIRQEGSGYKAAIREFDLNTGEFVVDNGFQIPEATMSRASWVDENTLLVSPTVRQEDISFAKCPLSVQKWERGQSLSSATDIYRRARSAMSHPVRINTAAKPVMLIRDLSTIQQSDYYLLNVKLEKTKLPLPTSAFIEGHLSGQFIVSLKDNWEVLGQSYQSGEIVSVQLNPDNASQIKSVYSVWKPTNAQAIYQLSYFNQGILINYLEHVKGQLKYLKWNAGTSTWETKSLGLPANKHYTINKKHSTSITANTDADHFYFYEEDFLTPRKYYRYTVDGGYDLLKQLPAAFDASAYKIEQHFTPSNDGTRIPYFVVMKKDASLNGQNPTVLYGYGGFGESKLPEYHKHLGKAWLEKGGVYVLANIRGGGEYGPRWHHAARVKNRHKSFEDFESVARDLVKRKITSASKLGILGVSNGGLLVGATLMRHPELYGAAASLVPVLDMKRSPYIAKGAGYYGEFGNPAKIWNYMRTYSPYHNVREDATYPKVLMMCSTSDVVVGPAHARKMTALLQSKGHEVWFFESENGGHALGQNTQDYAYKEALVYQYFEKMLMED
ncbi:prolyl oligopeptidase family serine peptidase [Algicola sagamiensis]|uniref:prolyl oligopeptidase family serine peptidase n=1 Tax=Algicola sagamiensis TaxID=163869 RepID=UPI00146EE002|nr:prolyl oligopeptidase family serine peptidase [Algicola sagamiensis]